MEPAKPARPWGNCITQTASPAAPVVSKTQFSGDISFRCFLSLPVESFWNGRTEKQLEA